MSEDTMEEGGIGEVFTIEESIDNNLGWLPDFVFRGGEDERASGHVQILDYLSTISEWFGDLKREDISSQGLVLLEKHRQGWAKWIVQNYYKNSLARGIKKTDTVSSEKRFYGENTNEVDTKEITEDEDVIDNGLYDSVSMHICVEFMNFFRLLFPGQKQNTVVVSRHRPLRVHRRKDDPPPMTIKLFIRTIIENQIKKCPVNDLERMINSGLGYLSVIFEETEENAQKSNTKPVGEDEEQHDEQIEVDDPTDKFPDFNTLVPVRTLEGGRIVEVNPTTNADVSDDEIPEKLYSASEGEDEEEESENSNSDSESQESVENDIDAVEESDDEGITYEQHVKRTEDLPPREELGPTPYEIFSLMHSYVYFMINIHPDWIGLKLLPNNLSMVKRKDSYVKNIDAMLKSYITAFEGYTSDAVFDKMERVMYCLSSCGSLRDIWLYSKIFHKDDTEFINKVRVMAFRPRRQKSSMFKYQRDVAEPIGKFNPLEHDLDYFWVDHGKEKTAVSENFKIFIFHLLVQFYMKYPAWIFRFVVLPEAFYKYEDLVKEVSMDVPLFIKIHPYEWNIMYRKVKLDGDVETLLGQWIEITQKRGIPACKDISKWKWIYTWKKYLRSAFEISEVAHELDKNRVLLYEKYRVELDDESKEKLLEQKKRERMSEEEIEEEMKWLKRRKTALETANDESRRKPKRVGGDQHTDQTRKKKKKSLEKDDDDLPNELPQDPIEEDVEQ